MVVTCRQLTTLGAKCSSSCFFSTTCFSILLLCLSKLFWETVLPSNSKRGNNFHEVVKHVLLWFKRGFMRSANRRVMFILPFYTMCQLFRNCGYNLEYVFCQQSKHKSSILLLALFWWKISRHGCFRDCNECMFVWNFLFSVLSWSRLKV